MDMEFQNAKGILHVDLMEHGTSVTSEAYSENLNKLKRAI